MSSKEKSKHLFFLLGLILSIAPYFEVIFRSDLVLLFRDLSQVILPHKKAWMDGVIELGRIPHWDPFHSGGKNFISDPAVGSLSPFNLVLLMLVPFTNLPRTIFFCILASHILIFSGFYLFFLSIKVRAYFAFLGALAISWSGFSMSSDNLFHMITSQVAVGFFLFFIRRKDIISLFAASAFLAWPVFCGDPQISYLLPIVAALFCIQTRECFFRLGKVVTLSALLAAPQVLPTIGFLIRERSIFEGDKSWLGLTCSLHPIRMFEFLFPFVFGDSALGFKRSDLVPGVGFPFIFSHYMGVIPVWFFLLSLFRIQKRASYSLKKLIAVGFAFFVCLMLPLGSFAPVPIYRWMMNIFPFWANFRYPERLSYWLFLLVVVGAVVFLDRVFRTPKAKIPFFSLGLLLSFFLLILSKIFIDDLAFSLIIGTILFISFLAITMAAPVGKNVKAVLLLCVLLFDLGGFAKKMVWHKETGLTQIEAYSWAQKVREDSSKNSSIAPDRFYSWLQPGLISIQQAGHAFDPSPEFSYWAGMQFDIPSYWKIKLPTGTSILSPNPPALKIGLLTEENRTKLLSIFSTKYFLLLKEGIPSSIVNLKALPKVFSPISVKYVEDEKMLHKSLLDPSWDFERMAILESAPQSLKHARDLTFKFFQKWDQAAIQIRANRDSPSTWIVWNESWDPNWSAHLGGRGLKLERVNGWAMGFQVPALKAGEEILVEFQYFDPWFHWGSLIALVWGSMFAIVILRRPRIPRA